MGEITIEVMTGASILAGAYSLCWHFVRGPIVQLVDRWERDWVRRSCEIKMSRWEDDGR